jgi:hypothetical protein
MPLGIDAGFTAFLQKLLVARKGRRFPYLQHEFTVTLDLCPLSTLDFEK